MDSHYRTIPDRNSRGIGGPFHGRIRREPYRHETSGGVWHALHHEPLAKTATMFLRNGRRTRRWPFVDQYIANLRQYRAIAMDVGDQDGLRVDAGKLHDLLDNYGVANSFTIYPGIHTSNVAFRFQDFVIPFFSRRLAFVAPAGPTKGRFCLAVSRQLAYGNADASMAGALASNSHWIHHSGRSRHSGARKAGRI